jgi:periplasmic protein TonB
VPEPTTPPVVETPPPPVQQPPTRPTPQPQQAQPERPPPTPPRQQPARQEPAPQPQQAAPAQGNNPQPVAVGGDGINVQMDGADFPFPAYLENVIVQINRHFRWSGAPNLETQVHFYILRDGSVGGMRVMRASGNVRFDLEATGAVEQAGRRGAFGPLPDGWQQDRLWVSFRFLPPR